MVPQAVGEGRACPAPRPPHRPAIPALVRGSSPVPQLRPLAPGAEPARYAGTELPGERILVYTIHDGRGVPSFVPIEGSPADSLGTHEPALTPSAHFRRDGRRKLRDLYRTERDWGANLVAGYLARHLGLGGYLRVEVARALLDFGRLPGSSPAGAAHLERRAIFSPISELLSPEVTQRLLRDGYDRLEATMTRRLAGKALSIAIHTYDPCDAAGNLRPALSLITGFAGRQPPTPDGDSAYDPLFPMDLREASCDTALCQRAMENLERNGHEVSLNDPYDLHEGSAELRAQGRFFFRYLRRRFTRAFPETADSTSYRRVWAMLGDVAQRAPESRVLHGFLHRSRPAPPGHEWACADGRRAYREIARFVGERRESLIRGYRFVHDRPSTLAIEVRKDLICDLDHDGAVAGLRVNAHHTARDLARRLAAAVAAYVRRDLPASTRSVPELLPRLPLTAGGLG